eukprot:247259-Pleurochrysis_carterae.AAC.2
MDYAVYKWGHPVATLAVTNGTIRHTCRITEILRSRARLGEVGHARAVTRKPVERSARAPLARMRCKCNSEKLITVHASDEKGRVTTIARIVRRAMMSSMNPPGESSPGLYSDMRCKRVCRISPHDPIGCIRSVAVFYVVPIVTYVKTMICL